MIDINVIRNDKAAVKAALEKRGYDADLDGILRLDEERRAVIGRTEALKAEKNKVSADVPGLKKAGAQAADPASKAKSAQEVMEEGECQTCKERKYQDGSDDMGVSFQTPTNIAPEQAASAVRGHENEHVVRERAKADREDRRVVSQSVTLHTDICPECGKAYVSGGTTRTVTAAQQQEQAADAQGPQLPQRTRQ